MSILPRKISAAFVLLPALFFSACSSSSTAPTLARLALAPAALSLVEGQMHAALAVTGVNTDATSAPITAGIAWSTSSASVAAVDATSGVITAGSHAGNAIVTATVVGPSGNIAASAVVTVTAVTPTLTSIALLPTSLSLTAGQTHAAFTVTGTYSDSSTAAITSSVTWSSSAAAVAAVDASSGAITAGTTAGSATITATVAGAAGNVTASATVLVTVPAITLASIAVAPSTVSLAIGLTHAALTVTGTYSDGSMAAITSGITWSSSASAVASVNFSTGVITAVATGMATISAVVAGPSGNLTASATITVPAPPPPTLSSIAVAPTTLSLLAGATHAALAVTGTYSNSTMAAITSGITWSSSAAAVASVDANTGVITAGSGAGTATITAMVAGPSGTLSSGALVTVSVPAPTLQSITATASLTLLEGATASAAIVVTAHYSDGTSPVVTTGVTFAAGSGIATVNAAGVVTAGSTAGMTTITSTYMGQNATTSVTVNAPPPPSYTILDFNAPLANGFAYATTPFGGSISSLTSTGIPGGAPTAGPQFVAITIPAAGPPQCYAGTSLSEGYSTSIGQVPFTAANTKVTLELYVPANAIGNVVDLKFADATNSAHTVETRQTLTASGWQTLTFDFSMQAAGTAALDPTFTFDSVAIFPDFTCANGGAEPSSDETFYIGALTFLGASAEAAPPLSPPPPPPMPTTTPTEPTYTAAQVIYILSTYFTSIGGTPHAIDNWSEFSGNISPPPAPVTIAGDTMYEFQFSAAEGYDGVSFGDQTANTANQIDATGLTTLHMDVWFSTSSGFDVQLIDNAAAGGAAEHFGNYTVPGTSIPAQTWVPLEITFAQLGLGTNVANLQQLILQPTDAATTVFVDNLYFH